MKKLNRILSVLLGLTLLLCACSGAAGTSSGAGEAEETGTAGAKEDSGAAEAQAEPSGEAAAVPERIDMTKWQYDADSDIYWQTGISYCASPADEAYETMGFFVPGVYFDAEDNGDGTWTCTVSASGQAGGYTAETAPMVIPVNTPGYAAMSAPTDSSSSCGYGSISDYTDAGFVMAFAGARGRDAGAPGGVTDFKAAIRYTRYNADLLPGDPDRFFSFGMSGGGAQSALIGATGNSALYTPYLEAIGAVQDVSDAVSGAMCWCPITNLDVADEAYEWNLGSARSGLEEDTQALSDAMAEEFARYINAVKLKDDAGNVLLLEESEDGIWQAGSYYEYIRRVIEESLEHFLVDTEFPYDASAASSGGHGPGGGNFGGFGGGDFGAGKPDRGMNGAEEDEASTAAGMDGTGTAGGSAAEGTETAQTGNAGETADYAAMDNISRNETEGGLSLTGTYETAAAYIDALNQDGEWVRYDAETGTVTITKVADFVAALKNPSKDVGAFDALDRSQGENELFGYGDGGAHFDAIEAALLAGTEYEDAFAEDLAKQDALGNTVDYRVNMYNPMYYISDYYDGAGSADVAKYFRIRTGIDQGDTALCTEVDLALALAAYGCEVDFETVWGLGHTEAERTGDSTENFIAWVNECAGT